MKVKYVCFAILIASFFGFAANALAQATSSERISAVNQIQILQSQVDILNQTNNKILNTIYWALGGLITALLTIVGLNFFQNFAINKGKFDSLQKQIEADLFTEKEKSTSAQQGAIASIQEENTKKLSSINASIDVKVKMAVEGSLREFKTNIDKINAEYEDVQRDNLVRKAFEHKAESRMGYIINLTEVLEIDIKKDSEWRINESLERISKCLDEGYKNAQSMADLNIVLNKLPEQYAFQKKMIEAKMTF